MNRTFTKPSKYCRTMFLPSNT